MSRSIYDEAFNFATIKHFNQKRRNGTKYVYHPCRVVNLLEKYFSEDEELSTMKVVGYLHDTLEDTDTTYEEIKEYFGIDVANYVKELTNDDKIKHDMGKSNYLKLKMLFMSPLAFKVKLCDRLDNVKDLVNSNSSQFMSRYINETLEIFNFLIFNRELDDEEYELVREILNNVKNLNNNYVRKLKIA